MSQQDSISTSSAIAPPIAKLAAALVGSCLLGSAVVITLRLLGTASADVAPGVISAAALGPIPVLVCGVLGLVVLRVLAAQGPARLPMAVLGCSSVRLLGSLFAGLIVFVTVAPEKQAFWFSFLVSGLLALVLETLIVTCWLPRGARAGTGEVSR